MSCFSSIICWEDYPFSMKLPLPFHQIFVGSIPVGLFQGSLFCSRDGGGWWAAVYGVAQSWTWLKWLSSSILFHCHIYLSFVQYHTFLITLSLCLLLKLSNVSPPFFSFLKNKSPSFCLIIQWLVQVFCIFIQSLESVYR